MLISKIKNADTVLGLSLLIVFALVLVVVWPVIIIWALNTLFPLLAITYTFWSWLAVAVLNVTYFSAKNKE